MQAVLGSGVCSWERQDAGRRAREANCGGNRGLEAGNWRIAGSENGRKKFLVKTLVSYRTGAKNVSAPIAASGESL